MLNERLLITLFYIFVYTFSLLYYLHTGYLYSDLKGLPLEHVDVLFFCYLFVLFCFLSFCLYCWVWQHYVNVKSISFGQSNLIHYVVLLVNVLYMAFSVTYSIGYSGVAVNNDVPKLFSWFFALIQPMYLVLIYVAYYAFSMKKIVTLNGLIIAVFFVAKGWLSPILYLVVILLARYKAQVSRYRWQIFSFVILTVLFSPILKLFKDVFLIYIQQQEGAGLDLSASFLRRLEYLRLSSFFEIYLFYAIKLLGRFDHLAVTYFSYINTIPSYMNLTNPFQEGWVGERFLTLGVLEYPQRYVASLIESSYIYQVHLPLSARFLLLPNQAVALLLYVLLYVPVAICIAKLISPSRVVGTLNWFVLIALCFHGWFYDAILWIQALIVFMALNVVVSKRRTSHLFSNSVNP